MIAISLGIAKLLSLFGSQINSVTGLEKTPFQLALLLTVLLSQLFVFTLSHNIINEEVKVERSDLSLLKQIESYLIRYLALLLFWLTCLFITTLLLIFTLMNFIY